RSYLLLAICFSIFLSTTFAMMLALPVRAAEYIVNSFDDAVDSNIGDGLCQTELTGNPCTLRAAIQESNASTQTADTVLLQPGIYTLVITGTFEDESATGDLDITGDITITGSGANTTTIQGGIGWDDRIFDI